MRVSIQSLLYNLTMLLTANILYEEVENNCDVCNCQNEEHDRLSDADNDKMIMAVVVVVMMVMMMMMIIIIIFRSLI